MEHETGGCVEEQLIIKIEMDEKNNLLKLNILNLRQVNLPCCLQEEFRIDGSPEIALFVKEEIPDHGPKSPISDTDNHNSNGQTDFKSTQFTTNTSDRCNHFNIKDEDKKLKLKSALYEYSDQAGLNCGSLSNNRTFIGIGKEHERESDISVKRKVVMKRRKDSHSSPLWCVICKKLFKNKKTLSKHLTVIHSRALLTCVKCFKTFKRESTLSTHINKAHRQFKCDFCNEVCTKKSLLNIHIRIKHESQCMYTCDYCQETMKLKKSLRNHILNVHGSGSYMCTICSRKFKCEQYLSRHIATVHTSLEHPCDVCGKVLRPKNLQLHMVNVHSGVRFKCELCGKMLKNKQYLRRHIIDLHRKQSPDSRSFHRCNLCSKIFKNKVSLKRHTLCVHTTGSYACNICNKNFRSEIYLLKHKTTVHVTEEHKCEFCKKVFRARPLLMKHTRLVHNASIAEYKRQPK